MVEVVVVAAAAAVIVAEAAAATSKAVKATGALTVIEEQLW